MTELVDIEAANTVRRDRYGRYLVLPPDGTKPVGYTRATTVAKALSDQSNLMKWGARMTALGLAGRPDLLALVQTADPDDRRTLDDLCERAKEAGGATARRDLGTALHSMIERSHLDPHYVVPEQYAADVTATNAAIEAHGFEVVEGMSEVMVVLDDLRVAGTADLILRRRNDDELFIADIKTGASVNYGSLEWAIQLAIYAAADAIYRQGEATDGSQDRRDGLPPVSRTEAIILHVQPGSGCCELYGLDIAKGRQALEVAMAVREWRKVKGLLVKIEARSDHNDPANPDGIEGAEVVGAVEATTPTVAAGPVTSPEGKGGSSPGHPSGDIRTAWVLERIDAVKAAGDAATRDFAVRLIDGAPTPRAVRAGEASWTDDQLDAYVAVLDVVEALHDIAFGAPDPTLPAPGPTPEAAVEAALRLAAPENTGQPVSQDKAHELRVLGGRFDGAERDLLFRWIAEAGRHGLSTRMPAEGDVPLRLYHVNTALLELTNLVTDTDTDTGPRAALALVIGEDAHRPVFPVGALVASLSTEQAHQLVEVCRTHRLATPGDQDAPTLVAA